MPENQELPTNFIKTSVVAVAFLSTSNKQKHFCAVVYFPNLCFNLDPFHVWPENNYDVF